MGGSTSEETRTRPEQQRHRRFRVLTIAVVALGIIVVAVVATVRLHGGAWFGRDCTAVGGVDLVSVTMPNHGAARIQTIELELSQGDQRSTARFAAQPEQVHGSRGFIPPGITVQIGVERLYVVPLTEFSPTWRPTADGRARLAVVGIGTGGQPVIQTTDSFTFDTWYPNGKECDAGDPTVRHTTVITDADLATTG